MEFVPYNIPATVLHEICHNNQYLILKHEAGWQVGINCKVADLAAKKNPYKPGKLTQYVSYRRCGFMEYLTHKIPF